MTFKAYFYKALLASFLLILIIAAASVFLNEFGIFGRADGLKLKPASDKWERQAKYLYAFNYIPSNYEGIIFGPSFSENLNPGIISNRRIYNASFAGGNASEMRGILETILYRKSNVQFVIFCLDPYITKSSGRRTQFMTQRDYWSALGSFDAVKRYAFRIGVKLGKLPDYIDENGYFDFTIYEAGRDARKAIKAVVDSNKSKNSNHLSIDENAMNDLKQMIRIAKGNGWKIFAFYYPQPRPIYEMNLTVHLEFKRRLCDSFDESDFVWDFNDKAYEWFTEDYGNYYDSCHLTKKGAARITQEIAKRLESALVSINE